MADENQQQRSRYANRVKFLNLSNADLAEIGGFSVDVAEEFVAEQRDFPEYLCVALDLLVQDLTYIKVLIVRRAARERRRTIYFFNDNVDLRAYFPNCPGRGKAAGGFAGLYNSAAKMAVEEIERMNIDIEQVEYDPAQKQIEPIPDSYVAFHMGLSNEGFEELATEIDSWTREQRADFLGIDPSEVIMPPSRPRGAREEAGSSAVGAAVI